MTDGYRQKLLNWFCSMLLALTVSTLGSSIVWFYQMPQFIVFPEKEDVSAVAGPLGEALVVFVVYFVPFAIWHFFDFVERPTSLSGWKRRLTGYYAFCLLAVATMVIWLVMATGVFEYNSCNSLKGVYYFECVVRPPLWLLFPWIGGVGLALLLCIAKAVASISSYRVKHQ